jgi:hypothetical protein
MQQCLEVESRVKRKQQKTEIITEIRMSLKVFFLGRRDVEIIIALCVGFSLGGLAPDFAALITFRERENYQHAWQF